MKNKMIKQFSISILTVLSLFVSSVAACACTHHQFKTETDAPSCHQAAHESENKNSSGKNEVQTLDQIAFDTSCVCFVPSTAKAFGKSETIKIQKQAAFFASEIEIVYGFVLARAPSATRFEFSKTSLSDSSYNIKSPRAPPRL